MKSALRITQKTPATVDMPWARACFSSAAPRGGALPKPSTAYVTTPGFRPGLVHAPQFRAAEAAWRLDRIQATDRTAIQEGLDGYHVNRGLKLARMWTAQCPIGPIEVHCSRKMQFERRFDRTKPIRLLTIGPGVGYFEFQLKKILGPAVKIDSFGPSDTIAREHRHAIDTMHLGCLETHRLPTGYDLVLSMFGAFHCEDQNMATAQIMGALAAGGHAFYDAPFSVLANDLPGNSHIPYNHRGLRTRLRDVSGIISGYSNASADGALVYMHAPKSIDDPWHVLEQVRSAGPNNDFRLQYTNGGQFESFDVERAAQTILEVTRRFHEPLATLMTQDAATKKQVEEAVYYRLLPMGFSLEGAVTHMASANLYPFNLLPRYIDPTE